MIVDTSFIIDIIDGNEAASKKVEDLEADGVPIVIPSMTVLELYIGVGKVAATQQEQQQVEAVLDSYPVVETTPQISRRAGRLLGERLAAADDGEGPGIGKGDATIAATALVRDEPVLSSDSRFETIDGLTVEPYR